MFFTWISPGFFVGFLRIPGFEVILLKITPEMVEYTKQLKAACGKINPDIAEEAYMSTSNVQRYINGDVKDADPEAYRRLILALGGDPDMVFNPSVPTQPFSSETLSQLLDSYDRKHDKEIDRLKEAHKETTDVQKASIVHKDKWINKLSIVILILFVMVVTLLIWSLKIDSMIADFGMIQYTSIVP